MKTVKLSARLRALANCINESTDKTKTIVDIGTDHGFLPVYLAQTEAVKSIIASDISSASLDSARKSAAEYNVTDAIKFIVTPGLENIQAHEAEILIIAGMGGETILGILSETPWLKTQKTKLILQPQSKLDLLSRFLYDNEYKIDETTQVHDRGKKYTIIKAHSL